MLACLPVRHEYEFLSERAGTLGMDDCNCFSGLLQKNILVIQRFKVVKAQEKLD